MKKPESTGEDHPFGQELAQVSEMAEQFGIGEKLQVIDEEEQELVAQGLCKFSAEDYLGEIQGLFSKFYDMPAPRHANRMGVVWI